MDIAWLAPGPEQPILFHFMFASAEMTLKLLESLNCVNPSTRPLSGSLNCKVGPLWFGLESLAHPADMDQMLVWVDLVLYPCDIWQKKKSDTPQLPCSEFELLNLLPNFLPSYVKHHQLLPNNGSNSKYATCQVLSEFLGSALALHLFIRYTSVVTCLHLGKLYIP